MIPGIVDQQIDDNQVGGGAVVFMAVGSDDAQTSPVVMTSPDGIIWSSGTAAAEAAVSNALLLAVATDGTRWVAVGCEDDVTTPVIMTTDDAGSSWTARTPDPATNAVLQGVAWSGSAFIAVGRDSSHNPIVMTSADGTTWTARTSDPTTLTRWSSVSAISGLAVAAGWVNSTNAPKIMSSADEGATWTARTSAPTTQRRLNGVACEASRSVIVGLPTSGTTTPIQSSADGTTWATETGDPSTGVDLYAICHNGTLFVAVGTDHSLQIDPKIMTSPDGDTWTARTPDPSSGGAGGINLVGVGAASDGTVVAVGRDQGFNESFIMSSDDGISWDERDPVPSAGTVLNAVAGI